MSNKLYTFQKIGIYGVLFELGFQIRWQKNSSSYTFRTVNFCILFEEFLIRVLDIKSIYKDGNGTVTWCPFSAIFLQAFFMLLPPLGGEGFFICPRQFACLFYYSNCVIYFYGWKPEVFCSKYKKNSWNDKILMSTCILFF